MEFHRNWLRALLVLLGGGQDTGCRIDFPGLATLEERKEEVAVDHGLPLLARPRPRFLGRPGRRPGGAAPLHRMLHQRAVLDGGLLDGGLEDRKRDAPRWCGSPGRQSLLQPGLQPGNPFPEGWRSDGVQRQRPERRENVSPDSSPLRILGGGGLPLVRPPSVLHVRAQQNRPFTRIDGLLPRHVRLSMSEPPLDVGELGEAAGAESSPPRPPRRAGTSRSATCRRTPRKWNKIEHRLFSHTAGVTATAAVSVSAWSCSASRSSTHSRSPTHPIPPQLRQVVCPTPRRERPAHSGEP